ncbi:MAG: hypothetical protein M1281_17845 [Chloroflexi bacterium]|nr:hypothetical protein [Chloroflexota bacterium]
MLELNAKQKASENAWIWLLKIVSGLLVFTLILIHLVVNHLVAPNGLLSYREVAAYLSTPGIALLETTFLVIVVAHALLGLRSILLDLKPSRGFLVAMNWGFMAIGAVSIGYGIWLIQTIIARGLGG